MNHHHHYYDERRNDQPAIEDHTHPFVTVVHDHDWLSGPVYWDHDKDTECEVKA